MENNIFFKFITDTLIPSYNEKEDGVITLKDLVDCLIGMNKKAEIIFTDKSTGKLKGRKPITKYHVKHMTSFLLDLYKSKKTEIDPIEYDHATDILVAQVVIKESKIITPDTLNKFCDALQLNWQIKLVRN